MTTQEIPCAQPEHTPGPWIVDPAAEAVYGTSHEGERIVVVYELNTNEADARLISAAPELLAFAREFLTDYQAEDGMNTMKHYANRAHTAISKYLGLHQ